MSPRRVAGQLPRERRRWRRDVILAELREAALEVAPAPAGPDRLMANIGEGAI